MTQPSLTFWRQLRPRPVTGSVLHSLAAPVRDPLWLLGGQLRWGQFRAVDGGTPAVTRVTMSERALPGVRPDRPLEPQLWDEPVTVTTALRAELGAWFDEEIGDPAAKALARTTFPLYEVPEPEIVAELAAAEWTADGGPVGPDRQPVAALAVLLGSHGLRAGRLRTVSADQWLLQGDTRQPPILITHRDGEVRLSVAATPDRESARLLLACAGRLPDGVAAHTAAAAGELPAALATAGARLVARVAAVYPRLGTDPPANWDAERQAYAAALGSVTVTPDADTTVGWWSMRWSGGLPPDTRSWGVLATPVQLPGAPHRRYWQFEDAAVDFGTVEPDRREVGKLLLLDFVLIQANDWYLVPVERRPGTVATVDELVVHDVFGARTLVPPAVSPSWSMFTLDPAGLATPPGGAALRGPALEETWVLPDEMAAQLWAVEQLVEDGLTGDRRVDAAALGRQRAADNPGADRYRIQSDVPPHWHRLEPDLVDATRGATVLRVRTIAGPRGIPNVVRGRVLGEVDQLRPEVPGHRGLRVTRHAFLGRGQDGRRLVWISRVVRPGAGESVTPPAWDQVVPPTPQ